ncbi:MAG: ATP-binding protein [Bacilli bacterium]|nr:ATP-binding protein [Bacilli bacterium]
MGKLVAKIVLTGGPCAGKTTTITKLEEHLIARGYHVLVLNECATEIIKGGIRPFGDYKASVYDFENEILNLQLYKEKRYKDFISRYDDDTKVIILYDRGSVDVKAYLGEENYKKMLEENHLNNQELLDEYDLVIHMTTVAIGTENKYSNASNKARFEEANEAIDLDRRTCEAWSKHKNLRLAPVCDLLDEKVNIVIGFVDELIDSLEK